MSTDALHERGKALEDLFFAERDRARIAALKAQAAREHSLADLAASTGITDQTVLARVVGLGVTADTLAALTSVPLLVVAWADGVLDAAERDAVLLEANDSGLRRDDPAYALLEGWLTRAPNPELIAAWRGFHAALVPHLDGSQKASLKATLISRAQRVARASGGVLGFGATSAEERKALDDLEALFA